MRLNFIIESDYADLPDEDQFEFPQECSSCGGEAAPGIVTCNCGEVFCDMCIKHARNYQTGWIYDGWKFAHDKNHLWACKYCSTKEPPIYTESDYDDLPDEDEFGFYCDGCGEDWNDDDKLIFYQNGPNKYKFKWDEEEIHILRCPICAHQGGFNGTFYESDYDDLPDEDEFEDNQLSPLKFAPRK